jgi:hypothetical protein
MAFGIGADARLILDSARYPFVTAAITPETHDSDWDARHPFYPMIRIGE